MRGYKCKHVKSAKFFRDSSTTSIVVILFENTKLISLFADNIARYTKNLSEIEIEEVVTILSHDKTAMLKQCNFPAIYDEMLSDLIEVQRVRYGAVIREGTSLPTKKRHLEKELEKLKDIGIRFQEVKTENDILRRMLLRWGTIREENLSKKSIERYGVKKDKKKKLGYSVSLYELEGILNEYFKIKKAHVYSIDVGSDRSNAERIDLESDSRYLVLSFREGGKKDETF